MVGLFPRNSEILISVFVVAIALLLLVPLPTFLLDFLLILNLATAFFLLLVVLYLPSAVQLLAFPTLLLLTTLFRLGLNVASTRLILSQGDAGQVIEAFGTFLVGGQLLVGAVVFAIITVINLLVIAKGSSRISEVAARFALDSLPGKQMSIDADLRAGLISPQEAEGKRDLLRKESQLYGAMDGAMKFVQGDALAGILIIFTNIIGGLVIGLMNGMPVPDAVTTYTTLTIGDGLVSQVPAFLIAVCAGIVVTRIGTSSNNTLGGDLRTQLFGHPHALLVVAGLLLLLCLVEEMPLSPLLMTAILALGIWWWLRQTSDRFSPEQLLLDRPLNAPLALAHSQQLLLPYERSYTLAVGPGRLAYDIQRSIEKFSAKWGDIGRESSTFFGQAIAVPQAEVDPLLESNEFEIRRGHQVFLRNEIPLEAVLFAVLHPAQARALGFSVVKEMEVPFFGGAGCWIAGEVGHLETALDCFRVLKFDWVELAALQVFEWFRRNPEEVVNMSSLHSQLKDLENTQPGLVSDAFAQTGMNVARLLTITHQLLREGVPALSLPRLLEDVCAYYSSTSHAQEDGDFDIGDITGFLRQRNRERIIGAQPLENGLVRVVKISPAVEAYLMKAGGRRLLGGGIQLSRGHYDSLREGLELILGPFRLKGILPVVIECSDVIRIPLFHFLHTLSFTVPMLCEEEIEMRYPKIVVSEWRLARE